MESIARRYFQSLFATKGIDETDHILTGVGKSISNEANMLLMKKFIESEVLLVLKVIGRKKGLAMIFFGFIFSEMLAQSRKIYNFLLFDSSE